jgi:hypothetical protein
MTPTGNPPTRHHHAQKATPLATTITARRAADGIAAADTSAARSTPGMRHAGTTNAHPELTSRLAARRSADRKSWK